MGKKVGSLRDWNGPSMSRKTAKCLAAQGQERSHPSSYHRKVGQTGVHQSLVAWNGKGGTVNNWCLNEGEKDGFLTRLRTRGYFQLEREDTCDYQVTERFARVEKKNHIQSKGPHNHKKKGKNNMTGFREAGGRSPH